MPALSYPTPDYQPFTKILSSDVNGKFNAIKTLLNTTGLTSSNVQQYGLTRDRLAVGSFRALVVNDGTGAMSELVAVVNGAVYFNASGVPTAGALPPASGGIGLAYTPVLADAGKVLQVNILGTALTMDTVPTPPPSKIYTYYRFG